MPAAIHALVENATAHGDITEVIHAAGGLPEPGTVPTPALWTPTGRPISERSRIGRLPSTLST